MTVVVELATLELHGHHGVEEDERSRGQRFLFDLEYEVGDEVLSDRIEDAVDYREVVACVRDVSQSRQFRLLETLAAAVADAVAARFPVARVRVRVRKPDVELGTRVEHTAATVERALERPR